MDVEQTRFRTATLVVAVIAILVVAAEGQMVLIKPLMPVAQYGDSVGVMKSPIMETTAKAISIVAMATYALFFGPGPPETLRSVRNAIIRGAGTEGKAHAFLKKASTYRAKLTKMHVRMYSRFYIT
jgi:hypothetical protein